MKYVRSELKRVFQKYLRKMNVSAEIEAAKTDPVHRKVDNDRIRRNYLKLIPATLFTVLIELCGMVYHLASSDNTLLKTVYVLVFSIMLSTSVVIWACINRELSRGGASRKTERVSTWLFWALCTIAFTVCSYIEAKDTGTFLQYLIYVVLFSLLPVFRPAIYTPYMVVSFAVQVFIMLTVEAPFTSILFVFGVTVFCITASFIRYSDYMANHIAFEQLELLAEYDELTNLLNRRGMHKRAEILLDYTFRVHAPMTVVVLDIDYFKNYNDTYGHEAGDRCLKALASCLAANYRRKTDIVCRLGGEEFLIVFVGEDVEHSVENLLHTQREIAKLNLKSGNPEFAEHVTCSIGAVTVHPSMDEPLQVHIKAADENLYRAKNAGRNRICLNGEVYMA